MGVCSSSDRLNRYEVSIPDEQEHKTVETITQPVFAESPITCITQLDQENDQMGLARDDGKVVVYDWKNDLIVREFKAHDKAINQIRTSDEQIYTCSRDMTIRHFCDTADEPIQTLSAHELTVSAISLDTSSKKLCSGGRDTMLCIWDIEKGKILQQNKTSRNLVTCLKWIENEPLIAQGSEDLRLRVWDTRISPISTAQTFTGYVYFPLCVDSSADTNYLFTSSKGFDGVGCEARVWDRRNEKLVFSLEGHRQDAVACVYITDTFAATASKDSSIKIWDTKAGELVVDCREASSGIFTSLYTITHPEDGNLPLLFASSFSSRIFIYSFDPLSKRLDRLRVISGSSE